MPTIQRPVKQFGFRTYTDDFNAAPVNPTPPPTNIYEIQTVEVDGDIDLLYTTINALDDANIAPGANISGTKIDWATVPVNVIDGADIKDQPNGIATAKINIGTTVVTTGVDQATPGGAITAATDLLTVTVTTRGGPVRIHAVMSGNITVADEGISTTLTLRLKRDGTVLLYNGAGTDAVFTQSAQQGGSGQTETFPYAVTIPFLDTPTAGAHTYTLEGERTAGNGSVAKGYRAMIVDEAA